MATIYKKKNSATPLPLTARVYSEGVEVHIYHELASCISYQWFYDDLLGGGAVEATGATSTSKEYQVDLTQVASSGEYYCEVKIGMTGCSNQVTQRKRVSIIECLFQTDRTFAATGASGQVAVVAPHYESPVFNAEGNSWIIASGGVVCSSTVGNVCTYSQSFTLTDQLASANSARRGQPTLTTGSHVCFFGIGQDFIRTQAPDPILVIPDVPAGPIITLTTSGPVFTEDNVVIGAKISYADVPGQTTPTIPDGLSVPGPVFTINSAPALDNNANPSDYYRDFDDLPSWTQKFTRTTAQTVTVTATYTDSNGATATASIDTEFLDRTTLETGMLGGTPSITLDWLNRPGSNARKASNLTATFNGAGLWEMNIVIHPWGVNRVRPTVDRPVKLSIGGFGGYGNNTTGGATSTDGGLDWDDLGPAHHLTSNNPLMEAPIGGGVVSKTFKFQGVGDIKGRLSLNATDDAGYNANTDDMNITVLVTIRPQT
jgi:hypothetical protein